MGLGQPGSGVPDNRFSVTWSSVQHFSPGRYRFQVTSDDGVRVYVDDELIIDGWHIQPATKFEAYRDIEQGLSLDPRGLLRGSRVCVDQLQVAGSSTLVKQALQQLQVDDNQKAPLLRAALFLFCVEIGLGKPRLCLVFVQSSPQLDGGRIQADTHHIVEHGLQQLRDWGANRPEACDLHQHFRVLLQQAADPGKVQRLAQQTRAASLVPTLVGDPGQTKQRAYVGIRIEIDRIGERLFQQPSCAGAVTALQQDQPKTDVGAVAIVVETIAAFQEVDDSF
ncbi:MAG: hypothetical protein HC802_06450 [Caldilineaceae bacterium]|nr:hypothetical protein [Caldilineaceae bacterium]